MQLVNLFKFDLCLEIERDPESHSTEELRESSQPLMAVVNDRLELYALNLLYLRLARNLVNVDDFSI